LFAIDNVDLTLAPGTITGVIGLNGAGKSTLIGLIGGALAPSQGSIRLAGRDVSRLPASERARAGIGRTYQIPRPFLDMSVEENLEVAQYSIEPFIRRDVARAERKALLDRTGLSDAARLFARALPLLRRKRLEVARALALKPRVVLLDEVGAVLVDSEITELIDLIKSILDPRTAIVIVEHVLRIVRECCARCIVLNFGKKLIEGPTGEVLANDEVASVYLGTHGSREVRSAPASDGKNDSARVIHLQAPADERKTLAPLIPEITAGDSKAPLLELKALRQAMVRPVSSRVSI
jgi:branched-chain amino acid transport system ATP-binding protein